MFIEIKPTAPGQLGSETEFDKSVIPWRVIRLHLVFDLYSEDDILKESPSYCVTKRLYNALSDSGFTGIELGDKVKTDLSETFKNIYPDKVLPDYYLITVVGEPNKDDFGIDHPNKLIVSENVHSLLTEHHLSDAKIISNE